jgi:hypothetical protein
MDVILLKQIHQTRMLRKNALNIISSLFALLFVYAAVSKLLDYQKFTVQLGQSPILANTSGFIAWFIPTVELLIAIFLSTPKLRSVGLYSFFGLMTAFTTYIVLASKFSDYVPCSCGGVLENLGWTAHLIFNAAFMLLAVTAILFQQSYEAAVAK